MNLPLLKELIPGSIGFGSLLLVEFEPDSIWYEASLTMAAQAIRDGIKSEYHTFVHLPNELRESLMKHGVRVDEVEKADTLRIIDDYTAQIGIMKKTERTRDTSLRVADWSIMATQQLKSGGTEADRRLHIDDNTSVLSRYNKENEIIDYWRTRLIPVSRVLQQVMVHSLVTRVHSEAFYAQLESWHDGIIDVKCEEREGRLEHYIRMRIVRGKPCDSRWRQLKMLDNGEVTLAG